MSKHRRVAVAVALALATPALPAAAQRDVEPIRPGQMVAGTLSASDLALSDGKRFRVFRLDVQQGRVYLLILRSAGFDGVLQVIRTTGPLTETLRSDYDVGEDDDARIRFVPPASGAYLAVVSSLGAEPDSGARAFELEVREAVERPAVPRPIAVGDSVRGELGEHSAASLQDGIPYDVYTFRARQAQRLRIALARVAGSLARARLGRWRDGALETLSAAEWTANIAGDGTVRVIIPEDGDYALQVSAIDIGGTAEYSLWLDERPPVRSTPRTAAFAAPGEVSDTLTDVDPLDDGRRYREWVYIAAAGERLRITMRSEHFDTYLAVVAPRSDSIVAANDDIITDNDEEQSTDSRVTLHAAEAGEYVIRAMSLDDRPGSYTLSVDAGRQAPSHARPTRRIGLGEEVHDSLTLSDPALELDGSPYHDWIYRATRANERVVVTLHSEDFDAFVMLAPRRNGTFEEFTSNDDAQPATNPERRMDSRLVAVLPAAGEYVIRVNTFAPDGSGGYRLRIDPAP